MSSDSVLSGGQIRAARAFLRWSAEALAERSKVGISTVKRAEGADGAAPITRANSEAIRRALDAAGVEFIPANGGGPGVRLRGHVHDGNVP